MQERDADAVRDLTDEQFERVWIKDVLEKGIFRNIYRDSYGGVYGPYEDKEKNRMLARLMINGLATNYEVWLYERYLRALRRAQFEVKRLRDCRRVA